MNRAGQNTAFSIVGGKAFWVLTFFLCAAANVDVRSAEPSNYLIAASRPELPRLRNAIEADWLRSTDLPLNNVLGLLGSELEISQGEFLSNIDVDEQEIIAAIENDRAFVASGGLKVNGTGSTSSDRLEISRHNARVAEYGALLREMEQFVARARLSRNAVQEVRREIGRQLANNPAYRTNSARLVALRTEAFDLILGLQTVHNDYLVLTEKVASLRAGYSDGSSILGRKRIDILATLDKKQAEEDIAIDRMTVALQAHRRENVDWDASQRKKSQELLDFATKKVTEFNANLPKMEKANEQLQTATEALHSYLNSLGDKKPIKRELNKRNRAIASAESNLEKTRETLESSKLAAENAKAAVTKFVDQWNTETKRRNAAVEKDAAKLQALKRERDLTPSLAKTELQKVAQLVDDEIRPLEEESNRKKNWCFSRVGDGYEKLLEAANEWISGRASASDILGENRDAWSQYREKALAQQIYGALSKAAEVESIQSQLISLPRFAELKLDEKQNAARSAWQSLQQAKLKAASEREVLAVERNKLLEKVRRREQGDVRESYLTNLNQTLAGFDRLRGLKRNVLETEFATIRNIFEYVIGVENLDLGKKQQLASEKARFADAFKSWQANNPQPFSRELTAKIEAWRKSSLINANRLRLSSEDDAGIPVGDLPIDVPVESWANIKAQDWREAIGVWFKNLEEREDGIFSIEKQMGKAITDESPQSQREFLNGLMERAFARGWSVQVVRFANRLGVTILQRTQTSHTFALTRFWSLRYLPRGTTFEKELFGDYQFQRFNTLNNLLTQSAEGFAAFGKSNSVPMNLEEIIPAAENSHFDQVCKSFTDSEEVLSLWQQTLSAADEKARFEKGMSFFASIQNNLRSKDISEAESVTTIRKMAEAARNAPPTIVDTTAPNFAVTSQEFRTNRVGSLEKLNSLRRSLDQNLKGLSDVRKALGGKRDAAAQMIETLRVLSDSFVRQWEWIWSNRLGNGMVGAWYSIETFVEETEQSVVAYDSAVERVEAAMDFERERLGAVREAIPILSVPESAVADLR